MNWNVAFSIAGGIVMVLMITVPLVKNRRPPHVDGARFGLNGILAGYHKSRNQMLVIMFGPLIFLPGLLIVRGPVSFITFMTVMTGGFMLMNWTYSANRKIAADYRREAFGLVEGIEDRFAILPFLETLDGEVRREEMIIHFKEFSDCYLYPSAIITSRDGLHERPLIAPAAAIAEMSYSARLVHVRKSPDYWIHSVHISGRDSRELCEVRLFQESGANMLMSALNRQFGTVRVQ
jgi:hypothetical protein